MIPSGFLLIDKPAGMTSHDVVDRVRRITGERTVGHAGTLDPFATGLLIVGVGRPATKEFQKLVGLDKEYEATFTFGVTSDTDDRMGKIEVKSGAWKVERLQIERALLEFTGDIKQIPPAYAAIKIGGKKMYEAAREGNPLKAEAREVTIHEFVLLGQSDASHARFRIACSSGTYIRALARDLGAALGVGGYVEELRRTKIGSFSVSDAVPLSSLSKENWTAHLKSVQTTHADASTLPKRANSATLRV
jgi:tRNA pseudouridine55 synthase